MKPARRRPIPTYDVLGLRKRCGLTQQELARAIGCTVRAIYRWEHLTPTGRQQARPRKVFILQLRALEREKFGDNVGNTPVLGAAEKPKEPLPAGPVAPVGILPSHFRL